MSEAKATPGPWRKVTKTRGSMAQRVVDVIVDGDGGEIIQESRQGPFGGTHLANFALIAAAPDMLEALKAIEQVLDGVLARRVRSLESVPGALMIARAAIQKAEGKS